MNRILLISATLLFSAATVVADMPDDFTELVRYADAATVQRWYEEGKDFVVIDVRTQKEFKNDGRVPGSVLHSYTLRDRDRDKNAVMLDRVADAFDTDRTLLLLCSHGMRATQAAWELQAFRGFTDVWVFPGGFEGHHMSGYGSGAGWKNAGLPLED